MATKQEMIQKMLEMQQKFMAYEQDNGVQPVEYYAAEEGHPLQGYAEEYRDLALKVMEIAHSEHGSER